MSIAPKCDRCGQELKALGALAFSPPATDGRTVCTVEKLHICATCWPLVKAVIEGRASAVLNGATTQGGQP